MLAHQRWFIADGGAPFDLNAALAPGAIAAVAASVVITAVLALLYRRLGRPQIIPGPFRLGGGPPLVAALYGALPVVLCLHLAIPLVVSGVQRQLFVPNLELAGDAVTAVGVFGLVASLAQIGIGLALFYGAFTRFASGALILLWAAGLVYFGPFRLLEHAVFPGIAAALLIMGRGPFGVDALLSRRLATALRPHLHRAVPLLRVGTGLSLAFVALGEKLWNLPLGLRFLETYPLNFTAALGIPLSDATFILAAGTVELTAGLLLITNTFVRAGILVLWFPFNLTLALFGWEELVGHLPVYGAMAMLALWGDGSREDLDALDRGLSQRPVLFGDTAAGDRDSA